MAITTYAGIVAAQKNIIPFNKLSSNVTLNSGPVRAYSPWYNGGLIGAASASGAGVNGEAVTPATTGVVTIPRTNPPGGTLAYLQKLTLNTPWNGTLWLVDRLWQNAGLSATLTTSQSITPAALPARDMDAATAGRGVFAALEWSAAAGAATVNATITYTNSAGTTGRSAVLSSLTSIPIGGFELFPLQAGDVGVQSIQSFIWSASHVSGSPVLVLYKLIAELDVPVGNMTCQLDELTGGFPKILDNTTYQLLFFPTANNNVLQMSGQLIEAWG